MCSNAENGNGCTCLIYKDPIFMTAQALSIVGFFISWGWGALFGVVAFLMLQVAWCCRMKKGCLITAGVFAAIAAVGSIAVGAYSFYYASSEAYYQSDVDAYTNVAILSTIGGILWVAVAVLVFVFACGRRLKKFTDADQNKEHSETAKNEDDVQVVAIPAQPVKPAEPTVSVNHVKVATPSARATVVDTPTTTKVKDFDEESWGSEAETVCDTDRNCKSKPDGTTVDTEVQTFTHRDQSRSSVKTVRLSKKVGDGNMKEKVTVIKTDVQGQQTKTSETNVIPFSDV